MNYFLEYKSLYNLWPPLHSTPPQETIQPWSPVVPGCSEKATAFSEHLVNIPSLKKTMAMRPWRPIGSIHRDQVVLSQKKPNHIPKSPESPTRS